MVLVMGEITTNAYIDMQQVVRETIKEIEEIKGMEKDDDEIGEILSARKADGKPDTVR